MKLPFSFSFKFVFRLLLPGFFVSLATLPILQSILKALGVSFPIESAFMICIIFVGWAFLFLDMPIYMLYEGRRYWPSKLRKRMLKSEQKRLDLLRRRYKESRKISDDRNYIELSVELRRFPMNEKGEFIALYPTRLGNLITSFEEYPKRVYGIDSIFYWYRIWLTLDEDTRENVDNLQALADSTLYTSFALSICGVLSTTYLVIDFLGIGWVNYLSSRLSLLLLALACFLFSYFIYRSSLHIHAQFGEIYKSIFDVFKGQINVNDAIEEVARITSDESIKTAPNRDMYKVAWRYLHNFRVKNKEGKSVLPSEISISSKDSEKDES